MLPELAPGLNISATGLRAERMRLEIAAHNLANTHTTKDVDGGHYKRREPVFRALMDDAMRDTSKSLRGVEVDDVIKIDSEPMTKYLPWHPSADDEGFVKLPNISPMMEMLDIMTATRSYEANLNAMKQGKLLYQQTIDLLK